MDKTALPMMTQIVNCRLVPWLGVAASVAVVGSGAVVGAVSLGLPVLQLSVAQHEVHTLSLSVMAPSQGAAGSGHASVEHARAKAVTA
jgi:hypothetical protein